MQAPVLTTARLVLRAHVRDDFSPLCAIWGDPAVVRFIGGQPRSATDCWARLMRYHGLWPMLGYGYWAACDRETGLYLGDVGVADFHRALGADFDATPETGWVMAREAAGRGLATEAMTAILDWCDGQGMARTVCMIEDGNRASERVAAKLGYRPFRSFDADGAPLTLYERRRGLGAPHSVS